MEINANNRGIIVIFTEISELSRLRNNKSSIIIRTALALLAGEC